MTINSVHLVGISGMDPEARYFESGTQKARFRLALNQGLDEQGKQKPATWVEIHAWGKTAEIITDQVSKGVKVAVSGYLREEVWTDRSTGEQRSKLLVVAQRVECFRATQQGGPPQSNQGLTQAPPAQTPAAQGWAHPAPQVAPAANGWGYGAASTGR